MRARDSNTPTSDAIRHRDDCAGAADQVEVPDPATAQPGTDAEAAGTPPTVQERQMEADASFTPSSGRPQRRTGFLWLMLAVMVALLLAAWWSLATR